LSRTILVIALLAAGARDARAADPPKEIANLFPAETLAYFELHNTAEIASQLAAVFKGTVLEDSIPFIHGRKDSAKTVAELGSKRQVALLGLLGSPELLAEFKKLRIGAGVTGIAQNGDPEAALVVLTHDSPAAGLAARAYLTMSPQLRRVGEISKIPIFQYRTPNIHYDPNGTQLIQNDKPFTDGPYEMTFAYTPGLFVIGTNKTAISHVLKRFLGEEKKGGLGGTSAFKEAVAAHRQTGLFFWVNYRDLNAKLSAAGQLNSLPRGEFDLRTLVTGGDSDLYQWFNLTSNPKAVKTLAGSVRFRDGGVAATVAATFDPAHKSPLLDLLSGPNVKMELLHHAPRPATYAIGLSLPEKNRAAVVIEFLDAVAKSTGELGRLPHDVVKEIEGKYKIAVAKDLIAKMKAVTIVMPARQDLPKGGKPGPTLVFHMADAGAATAWEGFVPKLLADLGGAASVGEPSLESINGIKVFTVSGVGLRWKAPVHYARNQATIAIGLDRKLVAAAVVANAAASVIGGGRMVSPPGGREPVAAFGVVSLGEVLPDLFMKPRPSGPVVPAENPLVMPNGQPVPETVIAELKKARKELTASFATFAPATVSARRSGNEVRFELFQPKVQNGALKPLIDATANWLDKTSSLGGMNGRFDDLEIIKGQR
jgi:hypothetical protein